ncbi:MAG: cell division protein FtsA [Nitrospinae bacterium]|nr:cell division protein FtsA [Nitrospinota bacterium]
MARRGEMVCGLDIGTTKICAIIGEPGEDGQLDIVGIGTYPSRGIRKGVVVNIESTVESAKGAVEEAELMAGVDVDSVYVGIAGGHIKGFNSHGVIAIKNREVTQPDIDRVIDAAKAIAMPLDREVIHVIPQEYLIDDQGGIREPLGMSGVRLEGKVHIVTAAVTSAQNIVKSVKKAQLQVKDIILEQLASAEAVLTPDEQELGVALVDIGGGTTDIAVFLDGSVKHTAVLAIGGSHITNDIAIGLRTPTAEAERIKKKFGCAMTALVHENETIEVPSVGGREPRVIHRRVLSDIIQPRAEEVFGLVRREIIKSGYDQQIPSGVVLTGGSNIMEGMVEVAERVFELPVRRGVPLGVGGLVDIVNSPMYATGVGLVLYGMRQTENNGSGFFGDRNLFNKIFQRMRSWVSSVL